MNLDPGLVGIALKAHHADITLRHTTNYAAAVEDTNPTYFDDERPGGIISHPMFPVAVTWPVLSRLDQFIQAEEFPAEILLTQVHYTEHLILHRLARPGDRLFIQGSIKAFIPHRAGTHALICLHAIDAKGLPVFTEYTGAMLRGIDCGKGGSAGELAAVPENGARDQSLWTSTIPISPERPYVYDGCTNIEFPIHTSPAFAKMVGLPGVILQGTATLAYAVREMVNKEADQDPERISEIACRFSGMVRPGAHIRISCTGRKPHTDHTDLFFEVKNAGDETVIKDGYVKIKKERRT